MKAETISIEIPPEPKEIALKTLKNDEKGKKVTFQIDEKNELGEKTMDSQKEMVRKLVNLTFFVISRNFS